MVRYMTDGEKRAVFFCDGCGNLLSKEDPGEPYFPDYAKFIEDVQNGCDDASQCQFLCRACFSKIGDAS